MKNIELNPSRLESYLLDSLWKNLQNSGKTGARNPTFHNFQPYISLIVQDPLALQAPLVVPNPHRPMVARFSPLDFSPALHDIPLHYAQRITLYDGEGIFTAIQHVDSFDDFINMEDVDYEYVNMRLFAQSLFREAKKWFRDFPARSILTFQAFQNSFLEGWYDKKSLLQVLSQYKNIKKWRFVSIHEFSRHFMRVYNSILADIKPLVGAAKLHYADAFQSHFVLLLRERKSTSIPNMFKDALELEANMMACGKMKHKIET